MKFRFDAYAFQDPPLCSSTSYITQYRVHVYGGTYEALCNYIFYSTYEGPLIDCTFLLLCCPHRHFDTNDSIHHRRHLLVDMHQ
jgi:hypothetical protein